MIKTDYPAFLTAPVQLNEAAAVPVCFPLYGEFITLSPSSSSLTAVVRDIRSSSDIWDQRFVYALRNHEIFRIDENTEFRLERNEKFLCNKMCHRN